MRLKRIALVGAAIIPLLCGCASTPVVLDPVGPAPAKPVPASSTTYAPTGWLKVLTATRTREIGAESYYYTHTGYRICTGPGQTWKYVANHEGDMDQSAALVKIPAGNYLVVAKSESYGVVTVPVLVQAGKLTVVHLESHWKAPAHLSTSKVVCLPNGDPVGWGVSGESLPDKSPVTVKS
jgi:hypothetical protein